MFFISLIFSLFLIPCESEDSMNCYWGGGSNQEGRAFVDIMGQPIYFD